MIKNILLGIFGIFIIGTCVVAWATEHFNSYPIFFDKNGQCTNGIIKIYADTSMPSTGNGFSIDISSAGFSSVKSVDVTAQNNTASVASMPIVIIKSYSTTAIVVNILSQNNSTTTILGITVLSGSPLQTIASTSGVVLHVRVVGN